MNTADIDNLISPLNAMFNAGAAPDSRVLLGYALTALTIFFVYKGVRRARRRLDKVVTMYAIASLMGGGALTNVGNIPGTIAQTLGLA